VECNFDVVTQQHWQYNRPTQYVHDHAHNSHT